MSHSSEHDHDFGHEDAHSKQKEETVALIEPAGFLNDLAFREEKDRTIHLTEFFPVSKVFAISHNRARVFSDMRRGKAKPLNFAQKRTLSTEKPNYRYHDILSSKHCSRGMLGYFQDASLLRLNPLSLVEPLGELPENVLDIRKLEEIFLPKRADIYILPATFTIRFRRFRRKHKKAIFRISLGISLSSVIAISALVGGAFIAKNELEAGYQSLESLAKTKTFAEFEARSQEARSHFRIAKPLLAVLSTIFDTPVYHSEKIRSANALGVGWSAIADSVQDIQKIFVDVRQSGNLQNIADIEQIFSSGSSVKVTDILRTHASDIVDLEKNLGDAVVAYSQVGDLGGSAMQNKFNEVTKLVFFAKETLSSYISHQDAILAALGDSRPMRYLILNQNRDELRASGGFPGSTVFIELYKGRISKYEKRDIYYYDWHLFPFAEAAPEGIKEISDKLGLRDANYDPEFGNTFTTIDRLYQKAGGSSLDGILAINQGIIVDFLAKYGSVRIPSINKTVDANNFSTLMSILVEWQVGRKTSAKDILFEFMGEFEKKLLTIKDYSGYFDIIQKEMRSGEILFAGKEDSVTTLAEEMLGNQEKWKTDTGNFVYPIFTSFSANKSDRYIARTFTLAAHKIADVPGASTTASGSASGSTAGMILNSFTLDTKHTMTIDDREKIRSLLHEMNIPTEKHEQLIYVEWAGKNRSWVRLVVPKGSRITGTPPIAIKTDDANPRYTVFSFEVTTEFLSSSRIFFDYLSPANLTSTTPTFYRQSGLVNYTTNIQ